MRTITVKKGSGEGAKFVNGWHALTVSKARYGEYKDSKFLDVWFTDYPDNFNARVYAKNGTDGEEFAIGRVFRFANAGITETLDGPENTTILKINDAAEELVDKKLNVFLYPDGKYSKALGQFAPVPFTGKADTFSEKDVAYWQSKAESYYTDYIKPKSETTNGVKEMDEVFGTDPF